MELLQKSSFRRVHVFDFGFAGICSVIPRNQSCGDTCRSTRELIIRRAAERMRESLHGARELTRGVHVQMKHRC